MKKNAFFSVIFAVFCIFMPINGYTQNIPVALGAVLEIGSGMLENENYGAGIVRITPFAGIWLDGLGFARIGASAGSQKEVDLEGNSKEAKRFDLSAQIGLSAIGAERPYIMASYARNKAYLPNSDASWNEWGLGIGHRFSLSPFAAIVLEAEHRWVAKHYDRLRSLDVSGRRLQMNFGFVVNPY